MRHFLADEKPINIAWQEINIFYEVSSFSRILPSFLKMDLPETILQQINQGQTDSLEIANHLNVDHQKVIGAIKSLESLGNVISSESYVIKRWQLTDEGQQVAKNGSHEAIVYQKVPKDGIAQPALMKLVGAVGKVGFSKAMSAGWIYIGE